jgi:TerC family integral membrane protein
MPVESVGTPGLWLGFTVFVLALLALDLGVFHRRAHAVGYREALGWSGFWVGLALGFALLVHRWFGSQPALAFLTGYLIEEALSVDNMFVFLVVFRYFAVPAELQHRVLFWGILGALVMRGIFILAGAALIERFHVILYVFGGFLLLTGIRLLRDQDAEIDPERNPVRRFFARFVPLVKEYRGQRFLVREGGRLFATPLLLVLAVIEATDVVFAVDSIPAIFGITTDPFIVYTSNVFAILGLRSLFFVLAGAMSRFHLLKLALGLVLAFVGIKMLVADLVEIPIVASLGVVAALFGGAIVLSLLFPRRAGAPGLPRPQDRGV